MALASRRERRLKRGIRARKKIHGDTERPRLVISRSSKHISAQIINDEEEKTVCGVSSYSPKIREALKNGSNIAAAEVIGKAIAEAAAEKGVKQVVFDRAGNKYHGRVKALADSARKTGLEF